MDVQDILFNICSKLDDEALRKLAEELSSWREVNELLKSNSFWYERTMHLAGRKLDDRPTANWRRIYYTLKFRQEYEASGGNLLLPLRTMSQIYGLDDLDTLLVLEQIYGLPNQKRLEYLMSIGTIRSPEVLNYLFKTGSLEHNNDNILDALDISSELKQTQMIEPLLDLILPGPSAERVQPFLLLTASERGESATVEILLNRSAKIGADTSFLENVLVRSASSRGDRATIQLLLSYVTSQEVRSQGMNAAAQHGNAQALRVMMEVLKPDLTEKKRLFLSATSADMEATMLLLLEDDPRVIDQKGLEWWLTWRLFLEDSIDKNHKRLVAYLLANHVSAATKGNEALKLAARMGSNMFKVVFSDPRVDPVPDLAAIIENSRLSERKDAAYLENIKKSRIFAIRGSLPSELASGNDLLPDREEIANILIRDKRVDIESLDVKTLRLVAWSIGSLIDRRVQAWTLEHSKLTSIIENDDSLYAVVLRFLIFKRPSNVELLDWMIEKKDVQLAIAAQLAIDNKIGRNPIAALLLSVLYPTLRVEEIETELREQDVDEETIGLTSSLINIHSS